MNIIVYGSIVYDRIMNFPGLFKDHILPDQIHNLSVSFVVDEFKETFGGAGANIAYNLLLLNEKPILYGSVGKDFQKYQEHFKKINAKGVKIYTKDYTAAAYIMTDKNDNQITGFFPGAMRYRCRPVALKNSDLVIISPANSNEMLDWVDKCHKAGTSFIFDPGQAIIQFTKNQLRQALKLASIYIVNDYELSLTKKITGYSFGTIKRTAGILITTLGGNGSFIEIDRNNEQGKFKIQAAKVKEVKDPTGAGDAYRAGLIVGVKTQLKSFQSKDYLRMDWHRIGLLGSLCSAYAVENYGTQNHKYTLNQFKNRYQLSFKSKYD